MSLACMLLQIAVACCLQGGCIIRAGFLDDIKNAYKRNPDLENLVLDEWFANKLAERQDAWRDVVKIAITNGNSQALYLSCNPFLTDRSQSDIGTYACIMLFCTC